jgi:hypothetical protein
MCNCVMKTQFRMHMIKTFLSCYRARVLRDPPGGHWCPRTEAQVPPRPPQPPLSMLLLMLVLGLNASAVAAACPRLKKLT